MRTLKEIAITTLRTTEMKQAVGTSYVEDTDGDTLIAQCASYLVFGQIGEELGYDLIPKDSGGSRFRGALVYANDRLGLSFAEIADLIEWGAIHTEMDGADLLDFQQRNPPKYTGKDIVPSIRVTDEIVQPCSASHRASLTILHDGHIHGF